MRALLHKRRIYEALTHGDYRSVEQDNFVCFVYERQRHDERCLVALNFSQDEQIVILPGYRAGRVLLSTYMDEAGEQELPELRLRPNEGVLMEINPR